MNRRLLRFASAAAGRCANALATFGGPFRGCAPSTDEAHG
jgi:hypothetical protein